MKNKIIIAFLVITLAACAPDMVFTPPINTVDAQNTAFADASKKIWQTQAAFPVIVPTQPTATFTPLIKRTATPILKSETLPRGPIYDLAIDTTSPNIIYAGLKGPGVYKSIDSGITWSAANIGLNGYELNVNILAIAPSMPSTLYAGTDYGVSKSTDGGINWRGFNTGLNYYGAGSNLAKTHIFTLAIDPTMPTTIYAGKFDAGYPWNFETGVFKSVDGGNNWHSVNTGFGDKYKISVSDLEIDPVTPTTIYAILYTSVFKSTDGADNWHELPLPYSG